MTAFITRNRTREAGYKLWLSLPPEQRKLIGYVCGQGWLIFNPPMIGNIWNEMFQREHDLSA